MLDYLNGCYYEKLHGKHLQHRAKKYFKDVIESNLMALSDDVEDLRTDDEIWISLKKKLIYCGCKTFEVQSIKHSILKLVVQKQFPIQFKYFQTSLRRGLSCGLVHCPRGNATDPIWRVLASSDGISSWNLNIETLTLTLWPINSGVLTSLLLPQLSSSLTDSLPSLNLFCHSKTDARFMQDGRKAAWSILYVSVAFFPGLNQNFIAYRSSKVSDCIFEIHQQQAFVECIPIAAVAVHLNLKS